MVIFVDPLVISYSKKFQIGFDIIQKQIKSDQYFVVYIYFMKTMYKAKIICYTKCI